jgi:NADP-reducing hydrogenase subunit HndB
MQSGCMTFCHSEPTVEVTLPGKEAVVFGKLDEAGARLLVQKYLKDGELIEGVIPVKDKRVVL